MPTIAILDDRKNDRDTIGKVVISTLKRLGKTDYWSVVMDGPPSKEYDVIEWLDENDAPVLITDWKLNEGARGEQVVNYEADALIREIRAKRPSFPIFVITGFESEARSYLREVENIFTREQFTRGAATIVPQMIRAGLRRYEEQHKLLGRMGDLSRRVAIGTATSSDLGELQSLHGYFQADLPSLIDLSVVLKQFEDAKAQADALRSRIQARLREMGGDK